MLLLRPLIKSCSGRPPVAASRLLAGAFTSTSDTLAADGTETSTAFTPAPLTVFHPGLRDEWREKFAQSFAVTEDFVSEEEEAGLAKEVEPHLRRQVYQQDHWDDAIVGFRETERKHWNTANKAVIHRLQETAFTNTHRLLPMVHILDLSHEGFIKPHVDSARFCGDTVAVLSLLSDAILRFRLDEDRCQMVDCLVKRRSLYVMSGASRYHFTHEILPGQDSTIAGKTVQRSRRISIVCRCDP